MKRVLATALLLIAATVEASSFDDAQKAVAGGQVEAALPLFEAALAGEPDSLLYANEYRKAVIQSSAYDRAIAYFETLTQAHPQAANAWLNLGYAYVDKIPAAGSISQVILANKALTQFTQSIALRRSWLALYTRGNSYLYWPKVFGRAPLGVADLEEAVALARQEARLRRVYARGWIALGDGYWRTDKREKARATWEEGAKLFPGDPQLAARLSRQGDEVEAYLYDQLDPNRRVDTNVAPLWEGD